MLKKLHSKLNRLHAIMTEFFPTIFGRINNFLEISTRINKNCKQELAVLLFLVFILAPTILARCFKAPATQLGCMVQNKTQTQLRFSRRYPIQTYQLDCSENRPQQNGLKQISACFQFATLSSHIKSFSYLGFSQDACHVASVPPGRKGKSQLPPVSREFFSLT